MGVLWPLPLASLGVAESPPKWLGGSSTTPFSPIWAWLNHLLAIWE